jgi:hypothetical protein
MCPSQAIDRGSVCTLYGVADGVVAPSPLTGVERPDVDSGTAASVSKLSPSATASNDIFLLCALTRLELCLRLAGEEVDTAGEPSGWS